ncbi:MAG: GNAT family N-acetyltransferase [Eubacteriales bacterium]|jgi:predicted N-acetyltransferase YhbS|nr:GNAT family N-acetyltransferase [Eubacteriales bacterium]
MPFTAVKINDSIRGECLGLLGDAFGGTDFTKLFLRLFNAGTPELSRHFALIAEDGGVAGVISNVELDLRAGRSRLRVSACGNVAVKECYRGRGLMGRLFDAVDAELAAGDFDISYLHGNRERYRYFGYEKCGVEYRFEFLRPNLQKRISGTHTYGFVPLDDPDLIKTAAGIYHSLPVHIEYTDAEFIPALRSHNRRTAGIMSRGRLVGSLAYNGEKIELFSCRDSAEFAAIILAFMDYTGTERLTFSAPEADYALLRQCRAYCESFSIVNPANFKIINFPKVVRAFLQLRADGTPVPDGSFTVDSDIFGKYRIGCNNSQAEVERFTGEADYKLNGYEVYDFLFNYPAGMFLPLPLYIPYLA